MEVADLLADSASSQATPQQANTSYDPFAQWSSSSQPKAAPSAAHDLFDPLAEGWYTFYVPIYGSNLRACQFDFINLHERI